MAWHWNNAQAQLVKQLRAKRPGIVIGGIGDENHSSTSQHTPDADRTVDAIDPMIQGNYTFAQAQEDVNAIVASRDRRMRTLIFNRRIISSVVQPWKWRTYTGTSDPHTGHWHMDTVQELEDDGSEWELDDMPSAEEIAAATVKAFVTELEKDEPGAKASALVRALRRIPLQYPFTATYSVNTLFLRLKEFLDGQGGSKKAK